MRARTHGPRSFDAVTVGQRETDAWAAYHRHEWPAFLRASVAMVAAGFGMNGPDTVRAATLEVAWVRGGCLPAHPQLAAERRALVASYAARLDAVGRSRT